MMRSKPLVIAVTVIAIVSIAVTEMRIAGFMSVDTARVSAYALSVVNLGVSIAGFWTGARLAWVAYFSLGVVGLILIGAATPLSALWTLTRLLFNA